MKRKNIIIFITLIVQSIILILLLVMWVKNKNHWTIETFENVKKSKISTKINSIREGLIIASELAKKWNNKAVLKSITICLTNKEQIKKETGIISYSFFAKNHNYLGHKSVCYYVDIDLGNNEISQYIIAYDEFDLPYNELSLGKMELRDLYQILKKPEIYEKIKNINQLLIIAKIENTNWFINVYTNREGLDGEISSITIEKETKKHFVMERN